jgi:hypothetical protein
MHWQVLEHACRVGLPFTMRATFLVEWAALSPSAPPKACRGYAYLPCPPRDRAGFFFASSSPGQAGVLRCRLPPGAGLGFAMLTLPSRVKLGFCRRAPGYPGWLASGVGRGEWPSYGLCARTTKTGPRLRSCPPVPRCRRFPSIRRPKALSRHVSPKACSSCVGFCLFCPLAGLAPGYLVFLCDIGELEPAWPRQH